jgi:radical SAM superfamily enzyme YgiQ (UPF0313 family)
MDRISYSSPERVIEEVRRCVEKGVRDIRFIDADFGSDLGRAKAVMRALIRERFATKLWVEFIPGSLDEELAALLREFGSLHASNAVTLGVGVQTINPEALRRIHRAVRIEQFERTLKLIREYGLCAKIDIIIGMPGEDMASIARTLEYMLAQLRGSTKHLLCCHVMRGLPGTELLDIAEGCGMVFSSRNEPHEFICSPDLPRADMLKCLRRTALVFRLTNHIGWAGSEFVSGRRSEDTSVRDAFFAAKDRLGVSHVAVIDRLIDGLMGHLRKRASWFVQPDFPNAETWWWAYSALEVRNEWIVDSLSRLQPEEKPPGRD